MSDHLDVGSLRTLCAAIAASDYEPLYKIKSILQIAHELIGTSSIVAYAYNPTTEELEIAAMPGVANREMMRGPTDRLVFWWEPPTSENATQGVWITGDAAYGQYLDHLEHLIREESASLNVRSPARAGDFRAREKQKKGLGIQPNTRLAMVKIYLWKGQGQTNDRVGQLFFNFSHTDASDVFTPELRQSIRFVSMLVREMLINTYYHRSEPRAHSTPEQLLRQLSTVSGPGGGDEAGLIAKMEQKFATIIREAALNVTENYGGRADFVLLVADMLGLVFGGGEHQPYDTVLFHPESITGTCIRQNKYYVGNNVRPEDWREFEFDPGECRSLMVVPVNYEGEVRAVIRLSSPRVGSFLDQHAKAMQDIEYLARYAILRLDERRQRKQMADALDFYTGNNGVAHIGYTGLMSGLLRALGAEWGTFWRIDGPDDNRQLVITRGIKFRPDGSDPVVPREAEVGIRIAGSETGFTRSLIARNLIRGGRIIYALHVLGDRQRRPGQVTTEYLLQELTRQDEADSSRHRLSRAEAQTKYYTDTHRIDGDEPLILNSNISRAQQHTRVAFVVRDDETPTAVVWLKFPGLHEIAWWERRYLDGLSSSLGKLLRNSSLELAAQDFKHLLPNLAQGASKEAQNLKDSASEHSDLWRGLDRIETSLLTILWKTAEVKTLLEIPTITTMADHPDTIFSRMPIGEYVRRAIDMSVKFRDGRGPWKQPHYLGLESGQTISGVFYVALFNILNNVVKHGWKAMDDDAVARQIVSLWIRRQNGNCITCVGNTGRPLAKDPFHNATILGGLQRVDGIGLRVVKDLLERHGGDIRCIDGDTLRAESPHAPAELLGCDTFFEFTVTLPGEVYERGPDSRRQ